MLFVLFVFGVVLSDEFFLEDFGIFVFVDVVYYDDGVLFVVKVEFG